MSAVDNIADQEFCYTWSSNKVTELEHYAGSTSGQSVLYEYEEGYTDVRTSGNDEYLGNSDDVITRYIFDEYCRSVAVYSSSVNGTEIYGATVGKYETQDEIKNNLKEHVTLGGSAVNYLLNGEFEPLYTSNMFEHWVVSGAVSGTPNDFDGEGEYSNVRSCFRSYGFSNAIRIFGSRQIHTVYAISHANIRRHLRSCGCFLYRRLRIISYRRDSVER
jgi:hypothetical protein